MKKKIKGKTLIIVILIFFVLDSILLVLFPRLMILLPTRLQFSKSKAPALYLVPQPKLITSIQANSTDDSLINLYGIKFSSPWGPEVDKKIYESTTSNPGTALLKFKDGTSLLIKDQGNISIVDGFSGGSQTANSSNNIDSGMSKSDLKKIESLFKTKIFDSDFNYYAFQLSQTPDQITLFTTQKELSIKYTFLVEKSMGISSLASKIYVYETDTFRGFEYQSKSTVYLQFWNRNQREYLLMIHNNSVEQKDIDLILSTLNATN